MIKIIEFKDFNIIVKSCVKCVLNIRDDTYPGIDKHTFCLINNKGYAFDKYMEKDFPLDCPLKDEDNTNGKKNR